MVGGAVVFYSGDVKSLVNDMQIAKPTLLPVVPRLLTRIYAKIQDSVKGSVVKRFLLNAAYRSKRAQLAKCDDGKLPSNDTLLDRLVFAKIRVLLGGHVRLIMIGAAPIAPKITEFLRASLGCVIMEGYGQTECVAPCTVTLPGDLRTGHVGPPIAAAVIKLVDVPEMGYRAAEGRGEVCVRGPIVFQGYFGDPARTASVLDADMWLHTGDIGQFTKVSDFEFVCILILFF